jgi:hypothetical protein
LLTPEGVVAEATAPWAARPTRGKKSRAQTYFDFDFIFLFSFGHVVVVRRARR